MAIMELPSLRIGDLEINPPVIQGGMGVRVSRGGLASAVAATGCAGVIATVGLGDFECGLAHEDLQVQEIEAVRAEIRGLRDRTDGIFGVNIMGVLANYENLMRTAVEEGVHFIISGAGLPLDMPSFVQGRSSDIKLIPVVSSGRTFKIICKRWKSNYGRLPDAVVVEGPMAGGHLGYAPDTVADGTAPDLETVLAEVLEIAKQFEPAIPVIAAGGVFDGKDIAHYLRLGASGVQMATRFVCTDECDAHVNFKQAYLDAKKEDVTIIQSPVGLPGRVINSPFVERIKRGETIPFQCAYRCLKTCDPGKAPYCIAKVLAKASEGKLDESFVFAGSNVWRCDEIVPVAELVDKIKAELAAALDEDKKEPVRATA